MAESASTFFGEFLDLLDDELTAQDRSILNDSLPITYFVSFTHVEPDMLYRNAL